MQKLGSTASVSNWSGRKSTVGGTGSDDFDMDGDDAGSDDENARSKSVGHWRRAVNITKLLQGKRLGREEGFANQCIKRFGG